MLMSDLIYSSFFILIFSFQFSFGQASFRCRVNQSLAPVGVSFCEISKKEVVSLVSFSPQTKRVLLEKHDFVKDSLQSYTLNFPLSFDKALSPTDIIKQSNGNLIASIEYDIDSFSPFRFSDSQIIQVLPNNSIGSSILLPFSVGHIVSSNNQLYFVERRILTAVGGVNILRVAMTDQNLNIAWIKSYEVVNPNFSIKITAHDALIDLNGDLLIVGDTDQFGFYIKLNKNGNLVFSKQFPNQKILSIANFSKEEFILFGIEGQKNIINIIDVEGHVLDYRQIETRVNPFFGKIMKNKNGKFYCIGQVKNSRPSKLFVFSFDEEFELLWAKQYNAKLHIFLKKIKSTIDGGFQFFTETGTLRFALTKIDSLGNVDSCSFINFCPSFIPNNPVLSQPIDWEENSMSELIPHSVTMSRITAPKWSKVCTENINPDFGDFEMPDSICISSFLKLKNTGSDLIDEWEWIFENGETEFSSKKEPDSIKFKSIGYFKVTRKGWYSGCLDSISKNVTVLPNEDLFLGNDTLICQDDFFEIAPNFRKDLKVQWQDLSFQDEFFVESPGIYLATVIDTFCRTIHSDSINVDFFQPYIQNVSSQVPIDTFDCIETPVIQEIQIDNSLGIEWDDGDTNSVKEFRETGIFNFIVSKDNCNQLFQKTIVPANCNSDYYTPNSFSPNNDGINDVFSIYSNNNIEIQWLKIYDRWGSLIYFGKNIDLNLDGWNGLFNEEEMGEGIYSWVAAILLPNQKVKIDNGDILLLR